MTPAPVRTTDERTWWARWAERAGWIISGLAWALSYAAQYTLAHNHGYAWPLDLMWPATVDLATLVAMLLARDRQRRSLPTWEPWAIAAGSGAVMIGANILVAWPDPLAMAIHAWPPIIALACWHALVNDPRHLSVLVPTANASEDAAETPDGAGTMSDTRPASGPRTKVLSDRHAKARRAWENTRRRAGTMSVKQVVAAARIPGENDISDRTAGRWLAEWEANPISLVPTANEARRT